ncbi:MAG: RNA methyltransferase, partial [Vulcanisaeta sp.]
MIVLLTTVPGIEDLVIDEVREKLGNKVVHAEVFGESNVTGKVLVQLNNVVVDELKQLGTVEHVVLIL